MARKSWFSNWQLLFTPDMFIPFLIGGIAMGVLSNAIFQLLTNLLGGTSRTLGGIAVGAIGFLLAATVLLQRLIARKVSLAPIAGKNVPVARRGLILLVSNEETCRKAIEHHSSLLKWCWLLHSAQSLNKAVSLQKELEQAQVWCELVKIQDVYDVLEGQEKVAGIFAELPPGCAGSDVILDFTGMTVMVSVGAVLACRNGSQAIQYTPAVYDKQLAAYAPLTPIEVTFSWGQVAQTGNNKNRRKTGKDSSRRKRRSGSRTNSGRHGKYCQSSINNQY